MKKEITISAVTLKLVLIWIILAFLLAGLVALAAINIKNTTNQTFFIIFSLSIIFTIAYIAMRGKIKSITFIFDNNILEIIEKKRKNNFILRESKTPYSEIKNYNIYNIIAKIKKGGYILRIKSNVNNFYCVNFIGYDKNQQFDKTSFNEFKNIFNNNLNIRTRREFIDYIILFLSFLPWIICILGLLIFLSAIYYIFFVI